MVSKMGAINMGHLIRSRLRSPASSSVNICQTVPIVQLKTCKLSTDSNTHINGEFVEIERQNSILIIHMNRPEKRNAVNPQMSNELFDAFEQFGKDPLSSVAVLHGKDGDFCAGFDLEELGSLSSKDLEKITVWGSVSSQAPMGPSRIRLTKPIIGAVSGYAVAGGLELALLCDIRVVEENAVMGVFCRRFGVPLIDGGTVRLPRLIGLSRALDLILTGRPVKADEALKIGLANRVVPNGQSLIEAIKLAEEIAKFPQECMNLDRRSAYYSTYEANSIEDALKFELENGIKVVEQESIPGAKQFISGKGRHGSSKL